MSWSISVIGRPDAVVAEIERHSGSLNGQSKVEFDAAKPHLVGLVENNFAREGNGYMPPLVRLDASGSGTARGEEQVHRSCKVSIEPLYTKLV